MKKKISLVLYVLFNIIIGYNTVFAAQDSSVTGLRESLYYGIPTENGIFAAGATIAGWIIYIAIAISVIVLMIKGIKFITSSPEGKADVKKELIPWTVGIIILFTMNIVLNFISKFADQNINTL